MAIDDSIDLEARLERPGTAAGARQALRRALEEAALERPRLIAGLMARFRDLEIAEDALHSAFEEALEQWPRRGLPERPAAWLATAAHRRAVDQLRRLGRWRAKQELLLHESPQYEEPAADASRDLLDVVDDEVLCLLFTCCHPALAREAQVALMLHTVCGLRTEEIARAFLLPRATLAQRLVRAKRKIRDAGIPFQGPPRSLLHERLDQVLLTVYLIFNEGHGSTSPGGAELCREAHRLAGLLRELMPEEGEIEGLLALIELCEARRAARRDADGSYVELARQDRGLWDRAAIERACARVESALRRGRVGPFQVQAAIQAVHAEAARWEDTDWPQIVGLYEVLERMQPTPVVRLNRAVALRYAGDPRASLALLQEDEVRRELDAYAPYHAALAEALATLGRGHEAATSWRRAAGLTEEPAARAWLEERAGVAQP